MIKQISEIVLEAGEIVKTGFNSTKDIKFKGEVDLVTEYDVKTEEFLKEKLQKLFPDFTITWSAFCCNFYWYYDGKRGQVCSSI